MKKRRNEDTHEDMIDIEVNEMITFNAIVNSPASKL